MHLLCSILQLTTPSHFPRHRRARIYDREYRKAEVKIRVSTSTRRRVCKSYTPYITFVQWYHSVSRSLSPSSALVCSFWGEVAWDVLVDKQWPDGVHAKADEFAPLGMQASHSLGRGGYRHDTRAAVQDARRLEKIECFSNGCLRCSPRRKTLRELSMFLRTGG